MSQANAGRRQPAGRYDQPSLLAQRALAIVLSVLFIGLLAAIGVALYNRYGAQQVRGRVISFDVRSDSAVAVDIEVAKRRGRTAYCLVRARGRDGSEVGRDVAAVDPAGTDRRTARTTFTLATTARAVTGEVTACREEPLTRQDIAPRGTPGP